MISRGYLLLSAFLVVFAVFRQWYTTASLVEWTAIESRPPGLDAESRLARGERITITSLDQFGVELIKGIGSDLSERIIAKKSEILARSRELPCEDEHKALEVVRGIGAKTSKKLARYISFSPPGECGKKLVSVAKKKETGKSAKKHKKKKVD